MDVIKNIFSKNSYILDNLYCIVFKSALKPYVFVSLYRTQIFIVLHQIGRHDPGATSIDMF